MSDSDDETVRIRWESAADPRTWAPLVVMIWEHKVQAFPIDRALATARDLFAAAAAAESDAALFESLTDPGHLGLGEEDAAAIMADVRRRRTAMQQDLGAKPFLRIGAGYGWHTRGPFVHIHRGSLDIKCTPADAREDATALYEMAAGSVIDARMRHTLGEHGLDLVAIDGLLGEAKLLSRDKGLTL